MGTVDWSNGHQGARRVCQKRQGRRHYEQGRTKDYVEKFCPAVYWPIGVSQELYAACIDSFSDSRYAKRLSAGCPFGHSAAAWSRGQWDTNFWYKDTEMFSMQYIGI